MKSKRWIPDVADVFRNDFSVFSFITGYCKDNPDMEPETLDKIITKLRSIGNRMIGVIDLSETLNAVKIGSRVGWVSGEYCEITSE